MSLDSCLTRSLRSATGFLILSLLSPAMADLLCWACSFAFVPVSPPSPARWNQPLVSGKQAYRYAVSKSNSTSVASAGIANSDVPNFPMRGRCMLPSVVLVQAGTRLLSIAPIKGPKVNATAKHIPTSASALALFCGEVTSEIHAIESWTFPSLSPPTSRLAR